MGVEEGGAGLRGESRIKGREGAELKGTEASEEEPQSAVSNRPLELMRVKLPPFRVVARDYSILSSGAACCGGIRERFRPNNDAPLARGFISIHGPARAVDSRTRENIKSKNKNTTGQKIYISSGILRLHPKK